MRKATPSAPGFRLRGNTRAQRHSDLRPASRILAHQKPYFMRRSAPTRAIVNPCNAIALSQASTGLTRKQGHRRRTEAGIFAPKSTSAVDFTPFCLANVR